MKSCKHIQGQTESKVTVCQLLSPEALGVHDICAFKSNKIGQIASQSVVRSVNHGISDKHNQRTQEHAEGNVSRELFVFPTQWKF